MAIKRVTDLQVKRNAKLNEMKEIQEQVIAENRSKDEKESETYNSLKKQVETIDAQIREYEEFENISKLTGTPVVSEVRNEEKPMPVEFRDWLKDYTDGKTTSPFKFRADPWITTTDTGVIPKTVNPISLLTSPSATFLAQLGVDFATNLVGNYTLPSMAEVDANIASESGDASTSNMGSASITLAPQRFTHFQRISRETLVQNNPDIYQKILANLVAGVDNKIALQLFDDLETDAASQVYTKATTQNQINFTDILRLDACVGGLGGGKPAYVSDKITAAYLKGTAGLTNQAPMWQGGELAGYPAYSTRFANTDRLYFSTDWSQAVVGSWGAPTIIVDEVTRAKQGEIVLTIIKMADTGIANKRAFTWISDCSTY